MLGGTASGAPADSSASLSSEGRIGAFLVGSTSAPEQPATSTPAKPPAMMQWIGSARMVRIEAESMARSLADEPSVIGILPSPCSRPKPSPPVHASA